MLFVQGRISQKKSALGGLLTVQGSQGIVVKCTATIFFRTVDWTCLFTGPQIGPKGERCLGDKTTKKTVVLLLNRPFYSCALSDWPWIVSEAGGDLVLIQTSLLFIYRSCCSFAN